MASAGVLLLLMVSSSLLVCSGTAPSKQQIIKEKTKDFLKANLDKIRLTVVPFLSLIPVAGVFLSPIVNLVLMGVGVAVKKKSDLETITEMFRSLDSKLNEYHVEQKWDTWASGAYHKPEIKINTAWKEYQTLTETLKATTDRAVIKRQKDHFIEFYKKYESATEVLHQLLTAKGTTFITKIGDVLAERVHCHEIEIRAYTVFIHALIFKGNLLNILYYQMDEIKSDARVNAAAQTAYDAGKAMFEVHKKCISQSMTYVVKDVEKLIDGSKDLSELAKDIRKFLEKNYETYDWMVVAIKTKDSGHNKLKHKNKHAFFGFTEVTKGAVSVAVARQVKGAHTKAGDAGKAIARCLNAKTKCDDVPKKLSNCKEMAAGNIQVAQTYTAVHAFKKDGQQSLSGVKEDEDDIIQVPESAPYYHTGKCVRNVQDHGSYTVMVKSDKEMMKDICGGVDCGSHGKCEVIPQTSVGVCECQDQYYGEKCEGSLDQYKRELMKRAIKVTDSRSHSKSRGP
ncbi:uncharacterized protein PAE49_023014 [Odontesthes bonariensis]